MSTIVEALPTLKDTNFASSIMKEEEEEQKMTKICSELRENTDIVVEELSKEILINKHVGIQVKEIDDINRNRNKNNNSDACLKSNADELNVDPKSTSIKHREKHVETDESLSNEKQQLPKSTEISIAEDGKTAQVEILRLSVISPGRSDIVLPIPFPCTTSKTTLFTLKEGSKYRIKFHLTVSGATAHNLIYTYMVWKSGVRVHQTKKMVGTFRPRPEPYVYELEEGTTPTGFFARGPFLVKSKFVDDDGNCYLDTNYYFDIRKDWGAREKC